MHQVAAIVLTIFVTLSWNSASAQAVPSVNVQVRVGNSCELANLRIPCSDVGEKLRALGTPLNALVYLLPDAGSDFDSVSTALASLKAAGFTFKLGYVNVQSQ